MSASISAVNRTAVTGSPVVVARGGAVVVVIVVVAFFSAVVVVVLRPRGCRPEFPLFLPLVDFPPLFCFESEIFFVEAVAVLVVVALEAVLTV